MRWTLRTRVLLSAATMAAATVAVPSSMVLTAENDVPGTKAGDGASLISGYVISDVQYTLSDIDPRNLSKVEFKLDGAASDVRAKVSTASLTWTKCVADPIDETAYGCSFIGQSVEDADELAVIAVQ